MLSFSFLWALSYERTGSVGRNMGSSRQYEYRSVERLHVVYELSPASTKSTWLRWCTQTPRYSFIPTFSPSSRGDIIG